MADLSPLNPASRRLLVINPNTNPDVTRRVAEHVAASIGSDLAIEVINPPSGPTSIETEADRNCAAPAVLDLIRQSPDRDGYLLACFDDIAVEEARHLVSAPVISMAQAAIEAAVLGGNRFTVITTVEEQVPAIRALLDKYGARDIATVRACRIGVAEASDRTEPAEILLDRQIRAALATDAAGAIVLGSGAYAGRAAELAAAYGVPFIDGIEAAIGRLA